MKITLEKVALEIPDALVKALADAVRAELGHVARSGDELVDRRGAVALGLGPRQLLELVKRGEIAGYRQGRRIVARRADVIAWVERQRVGPALEEPSAMLATAKATVDPITAGLAAGRLRVLRGGGRR